MYALSVAMFFMISVYLFIGHKISVRAKSKGRRYRGVIQAKAISKDMAVREYGNRTMHF